MFECSAQYISTVAGTGVAGYTGDGNACTSATLNIPQNVAFDNSGNLYVADKENNVIRKINAAGIISTVAGEGTAGYSGDGGLATSARLKKPTGIAIDATGNLYIADCANHVVRKVNSGGIITTIAGTGVGGYDGNGGPATAAKLKNPYGIAVDNLGSIYFSETSNYCVRKINPSGVISLVAGNNTAGYSGDGGPATSAQLKFPGYIAVNSTGEVYIPDWANYRVRKVSSTGIITTIAGNGTIGNDGDGGPATSAKLSAPNSVQFDNDGNMLIADPNANVLRKINSAGVISTIAGNGSSGFSGDGNFALFAQLNAPNGIAVNSSGVIYFADVNNNRIRKITNAPVSTPTIERMPVLATIMPNPATNKITIANSSAINSISIADVSGRQAVPNYDRQDEKTMIADVRSLVPGIYYLSVNGVYAGAFVKE